MKEEPFFIVNEFLEKDKNEIVKILETLKAEPVDYYNKAVFLKNFTNLMLKAHQNQTYKHKIKNDEISNKLEKIKLQKQKDELLKRLKELEEKSKNVEKKDVVLSKETGKTLVKSSYDGTKYIVKEPELNEQQKNTLKNLEDNTALGILNNDKKIKDIISEELKKNNLELSENNFDIIRYYLVRDLKRYGVLSPLIEDKKITDIVCDGEGKNITITYEGKHEVITNIIIEKDEEINKIIERLAKKMNQSLNKENPFINGEIEKGLELQATYGNEFMKPKFVITRRN
ncbi:MAG: hypothetical protein AABW52_05400 [Nanoarchaeota archaeon]